MDILSNIRGLSYSVTDLYQQISNQGWEVKKHKYDSAKDRFVCSVKSPHGEELDGWGRTERLAVANALHQLVARNSMRMGKVSMWSTTFTSELPQIAEAYSKAPLYDPKAAIAFMDLAHDAEARAKTLQDHLQITVVNNPEPYPNAEKMCDDIRKRRKLEVSRVGTEHPIWSAEQVVAFRIAFDVLGFCASGGDWGWEGTNLAFAAYAAIIPAEAQGALFTETIGQTAYATYFRAFGPQKIALFPEFVEPAQQEENPHQGYRGVHPSQSLAPLSQPKVKPLYSSYMGNDGLIQKTAGAGLLDPNEGWQSGVAPLPVNAYLDHRDEEGLDPLQKQRSMDNAQLIDTEWAYLDKNNPQQLEQMKLAITNAFKVVLLSPRKDLRWNAIHYQDVADMNSEDPTDYWHRLEERRQTWNVERHGEDARYQHMPYYQQWKALEQLMFQRDPRAGWPAAIKRARQTLVRWQAQEQEAVMAGDEHLPEEKRRDMYAIELEANKRLTQRLNNYVKEHQLGFDILSRTVKEPTKEKLLQQPYQGPVDTMFDAPQTAEMPDKSKYGAFMGTHLQAIAQISEHVDEILKAALWDVHEHQQKGAGYHFRAAVLNMNIPGVGPKVCSFAWLLLQPMTSQLATIDTHMMDVLGHDFENDMSPRDYFKFERELATGRDAAGYGTMPLGAFQWSMWDHKRTGPGTHQDHSAMKVLNPLSHEQIDWENKQPNSLKGGSWPAPDWWSATQPARDAVAADWDQTVAPNIPQNQIPYNQGVPQAVYAKTAGSHLIPWFTHPQTGERIVGQPGQTIMQHAQSIGLGVPEAWKQLTEAGKS